MFTAKKIPATVFAVGMALERNPQVCKAMLEANWEVASHGYRWIDYQEVDEETEREHIARTIEIHEHLLGKRPVGIYQGKVSCTLFPQMQRNLHERIYLINHLPSSPMKTLANLLSKKAASCMIQTPIAMIYPIGRSNTARNPT